MGLKISDFADVEQKETDAYQLLGCLDWCLLRFLIKMMVLKTKNPAVRLGFLALQLISFKVR